MTTTVTSKEDQTLARLLRHMEAVREYWDHVAYMKEALRLDDKFMFVESWQELSDATKSALWIAPKYGGIWSTIEREQIRAFTSDREARAYAKAHQDEYQNRN